MRDCRGDHLFEVLLREAKLFWMINQVMKSMHPVQSTITVKKMKLFAILLALVPKNNNQCCVFFVRMERIRESKQVFSGSDVYAYGRWVHEDCYSEVRSDGQAWKGVNMSLLCHVTSLLHSYKLILFLCICRIKF